MELYFQCCSLETNLLGAGLISSTLANGGVNPWTNEKIFEYDNVKSILSIMYNSGMYDFSGEWGYSIGIPAKSGVSGLVYSVIPNVGGIAVYSPKLDKLGNSYRGIDFFKRLSNRVNIHVYENLNCYKFNIRHKDNNNKKILGYLLLDAAFNDDLETIKECLSKGCDINFSDYDNRTALHIAYSENKIETIKYLEENNANKDIKDRWDKTCTEYINKK